MRLPGLRRNRLLYLHCSITLTWNKINLLLSCPIARSFTLFISVGISLPHFIVLIPLVFYFSGFNDFTYLSHFLISVLSSSYFILFSSIPSYLLDLLLFYYLFILHLLFLTFALLCLCFIFSFLLSLFGLFLGHITCLLPFFFFLLFSPSFYFFLIYFICFIHCCIIFHILLFLILSAYWMWRLNTQPSEKSCEANPGPTWRWTLCLLKMALQYFPIDKPFILSSAPPSKIINWCKIGDLGIKFSQEDIRFAYSDNILEWPEEPGFLASFAIELPCVHHVF